MMLQWFLCKVAKNEYMSKFVTSAVTKVVWEAQKSEEKDMDMM